MCWGCNEELLNSQSEKLWQGFRRMPLWLGWTYTHTHTQTQRYTLRLTYAQRQQQTANTKIKRSCHSYIVSQSVKSSYWYWKILSENLPLCFCSFIFCFPLNIINVGVRLQTSYENFIWEASSQRRNYKFVNYKNSRTSSLPSFINKPVMPGHIFGQVHLISSFCLQAPNWNGSPNGTNGKCTIPSSLQPPNTNWSSRNETCINFNLYLSCWWPAPFTPPLEAQITPIITLIPTAHGALSGN